MKFLKNISPILFSLLILISSSGAVLTKHYCHGKLQSIDITDKHTCDHCDDDDEHNHKSCCDDEVIKIKVEDTDIAKFDFKIKKQVVEYLLSVFLINNLLINSSTECINFWVDYSPPTLVQDIPVLVQSFLI